MIHQSKLIFCISQNEHIYSEHYSENVTIFNSYNMKSADRLQGLIDNKMFNKIREKDNCKLLSGGEKQVLSLFRIFMTDTPVWVMDEIFSATDMGLTKKLRSFVISEKEKTVIMVTHKLSEDLKDFDEILLMKNGKLVESGSYEDISKSKEYLELKSES